MINFKILKQYGWDDFFDAQMEKFSKEGYSVGRVAIENKSNFILYTEFGELTAGLSGKFKFNASSESDYPGVGDWVVIKPMIEESKAVIEFVLERKNKFSRKVPGMTTEEQIIAANIDTIFIISSLNQDINLRRIERYLTLAFENNIPSALILSKSDVCDDVREKLTEVESIAGESEIYVISALENKGTDELKKYFSDNRTVAVVGSSGVGKSTLINCLSGSDDMEVSDISLYKDRGRHTTSHRELIILPGGGLIIDTPGMREIQVWEGSDGMSETFTDVEQYFSECKFTDCKHETEPGCAIIKAIENGELDEKRYKNYVKMQKEVKHFENMNNQKAKLAEKRKWKKVSAELKRKGNFKK